MTTLQAHQQVVATAGDAVARIKGINHIQIIVRDMDASVHFYRNVLGLKVMKTMGKRDLDRVTQSPVMRNYFFELGNGELITLIEVPDAPAPEPSIWDLWPQDPASPLTIRKMDHLALNVDTYADLQWFRQQLITNGVEVTDILGRETFVRSIYFADPTGNPLEIATFDWSNPSWAGHESADWLADEEPVDSLLSAD